jgi:hypothetical protein
VQDGKQRRGGGADDQAEKKSTRVKMARDKSSGGRCR